MRPGYLEWVWITPILAIAIVLVPRVLPPAARRYFATGSSAAAVVVSSFLFGGSWSWLKVGYEYPLRRFDGLASGPTNNLPSYLSQAPYDWHLYDTVWTLWEKSG